MESFPAAYGVEVPMTFGHDDDALRTAHRGGCRRFDRPSAVPAGHAQSRSSACRRIPDSGVSNRASYLVVSADAPFRAFGIGHLAVTVLSGLPPDLAPACVLKCLWAAETIMMSFVRGMQSKKGPLKSR